jgi:hypothetical protein
MNLAGWAFSTTGTGFCPSAYNGDGEKYKQETHTSIFASTFLAFLAFLFSTFVQPSSVSSTRTSKGFGDILTFLWAGELGVGVVEGWDRFIATWENSRSRPLIKSLAPVWHSGSGRANHALSHSSLKIYYKKTLQLQLTSCG